MRHHVLPNGKRVHLQGWKRDRPDHGDRLFLAVPEEEGILPREHDLRSSPHMPPVFDQGDLGSCTCASSKNAVRFEANLQGEVFDPSTLWMYDKVREYEGTPLTEDSGAQIRDVVRGVLEHFGAPPESSYPYDTGLYATPPPPELDAEALKHKVLVAYRCSHGVGPSLKLVQASIAQGRPVVGGFSVPESMMTAECAIDGIVNLPTAKEKIVGGHAVLFVGYKYIGSVLYLVFMNSWGLDWADNGFGYLDSRYLTSGLADDFWSIRRVA